MLPIIVAAFALLAVCIVVGVKWKTKQLRDRQQRPMKESQENQQNAETQRERYYATIHKVALQQATNTGGTDKIPGEPLVCYITRELFIHNIKKIILLLVSLEYVEFIMTN